jgi:isopenicillin-N N-acyltransferase-like protein
LLAQNWDWVGAQREALIVLRIPESDAPACLTLTEAGMLAKIGLNASGVGVCLNILRSVFDGTQTGVPVHVLLRSLLKRRSVRDAIEFCSTLAFGGSSNILMADRGGDAASLEFSPKGLKVVRGEGATLCHTNHFIHPDAAGWKATQLPNLSTGPLLERALWHAAASPRHGIEDLKCLLRDESAELLRSRPARDPAPGLVRFGRSDRPNDRDSRRFAPASGPRPQKTSTVGNSIWAHRLGSTMPSARRAASASRVTRRPASPP